MKHAGVVYLAAGLVVLGLTAPVAAQEWVIRKEVVVKASLVEVWKA